MLANILTMTMVSREKDTAVRSYDAHPLAGGYNLDGEWREPVKRHECPQDIVMVRTKIDKNLSQFTLKEAKIAWLILEKIKQLAQNTK